MVAVSAMGVIALAACGSGGSNHAAGNSYGAPVVSTSGNATSDNNVHTGNTSLGAVLVDGNGMTLYGLTKDVNGVSSCTGSCAMVWPPVTVSGPTLPAGLDAKTFSVSTRPDGSHQLRAGKWPLYRYAGDGAPGDTNGQGSGGVWFVVAPTGQLHKS
jgi:predicted lipoprotein with Yx(FWY)xxD motif